jgi:3-hydroxyisobutyrate dehydrogenase-like beta-hydroxyacid dehydrogenase
VVLALFDTPATVRVLEGPDGLLHASHPPAHVIDTGTGDPEEVTALAGRLAARGVRYIDAPMSGSSAQIAARTATAMIGASPDDFAACRAVLDAMAAHVFHLGGPGAGMKAKLASNVIVGLNRVALAEGLACARALGLDLGAFLAMARTSAAYSVAMDAKGARMLAGRYGEPESRVRQHRKDVTLILRAAAAAGQRLPLSETHLALLDESLAAGDGDLDNAAIFRRYGAGK